MKTVIWTEDTRWEEAMWQGEQEEVVILRGGKPVALLVPFDDDDLEWYARERNPAFTDSIARARQQAQDGKTISHQELRKRLNIT